MTAPTVTSTVSPLTPQNQFSEDPVMCLIDATDELLIGVDQIVWLATVEVILPFGDELGPHYVRGPYGAPVSSMPCNAIAAS